MEHDLAPICPGSESALIATDRSAFHQIVRYLIFMHDNCLISRHYTTGVLDVDSILLLHAERDGGCKKKKPKSLQSTHERLFSCREKGNAHAPRQLFLRHRKNIAYERCTRGAQRIAITRLSNKQT